MRGRQYGGQQAEDRVAARREAFLDAGHRVFGTVGYHRATVRALCREAGLTERYFYESFEGTEALLLAVYARITTRLRDETLAKLTAAPPDPETWARLALESYFTLVQDDRRAARIMLREVLGVGPAIDRAYRETITGFAELLLQVARPAWPDGEPPRGDATLVATGLVGAAVSIAYRWSLGGCREPKALVVDSALAVLLAMTR